MWRGHRTPCRLSVADLRDVERHRRQELEPGARRAPGALAVPAAGEPRRSKVRRRLVTLIQHDMLVCPHVEGVVAVGVLELFEWLTGETFSDTPGALVGSRVRGMAKVPGNLSREERLEPPLLQTLRRSVVI